MKWFRKRDIDQTANFTSDDAPIKFFENFYEPLTSAGSGASLRSGSSTFYSKLILNDVTRASMHVCVAINYHGISYREFFIDINNNDDVDEESRDDDDEQSRELLELPERKYEILFAIPLIILISISAVLSTILYLLIRRSKKTVKCDYVLAQ